MDEQVPPNTPPKKRHGCFYYGCLSVIVLAVLFGGCIFTIFQYGRTTVTPVVEQFLSAGESGNYDQAYSMIGSEWKEKTSREEFPRLFESVHDTLGARQSMSMTGFNISSMPSGTFARAHYTATYDKEDAYLTVNLKKVDGQWQIFGIVFNSPKLESSLKCPNCGAFNAFDAKFCAKCGKPLHPKQENEPADK
jgi:ribosomal protein L40E